MSNFNLEKEVKERIMYLQSEKDDSNDTEIEGLEKILEIIDEYML
jgi:hypothetical protein